MANGGGGLAAMLDPPRDKPPYSLGCALCPLSYPLGSDNEGRLDILLSYCTPPAGKQGISVINVRLVLITCCDKIIGNSTLK